MAVNRRWRRPVFACTLQSGHLRVVSSLLLVYELAGNLGLGSESRVSDTAKVPQLGLLAELVRCEPLTGYLVLRRLPMEAIWRFLWNPGNSISALTEDYF